MSGMFASTVDFKVGKVTLQPILDDITQLQADALVQPSGTSPEGVPVQASPWVVAADRDGSIERALNHFSPLHLGDVIVTPPGLLNAKYLFSAVVLDWGHQHPSGQLIIDDVVVSAAQKCISIAAALDLKTIAFTPWGTRVGALEASHVTAIMAQAVVTALQARPGKLEVVYLISRDPQHYQWFVDRVFMFRIMFEQIMRIQNEVESLHITQQDREHILELLGNLQHNIVVYNEFVGGDKITSGDITGATGIAIGRHSLVKTENDTTKQTLFDKRV
jgi:O-acetyl-ADP-ribose deacetylase (regulator of RNase III)